MKAWRWRPQNAAWSCLLTGLFLGGLAPRIAWSEDASPSWTRFPTGDDIARVYPPDALKNNLAGQAAIKCLIGPGGKLKTCEVVAEAPANAGFGKAALALSGLFQGAHVAEGGSVTIPIRFSLYPGARRATATVENPPWTATPSLQDVIAAFPPAASGKIDSALVALNCTIGIDGSVLGCSVASAEPAGLGFEEAALKLSRKFKADIHWRIELNGDIKVNLPIRLAAADSAVWKNRDLGKIGWLRTADLAMAQSLFPSAALTAGVSSGSAVVGCSVSATGALTGCAPESETPAGLGFGPAVAQVAEAYIMNPWTTTGLPTDGAHVRLPMKLVHGP